MPGKDFAGEQFKEISIKEGNLSVELFGDKQEIPFKSVCFLNSDGTIGYAQMFIKGQDKLMFISKTLTCTVYTMPADRDDELPFGESGVRIWGVLGGEVDKYYEQHVRALKGEEPVHDAAWLKDELEKAPQTVMDIAMKMLGQILDAMGGPDGLMEKMGEAFTAQDGPMAQMADGIGKAFGEMAPIENVDETEKEGSGVPKKKAAAKKKAKAPAKRASPKKAPKKAKRPAGRKGKKKK
jgi:hypothetical protein